jgi:hypothetical protein
MPYITEVLKTNLEPALKKLEDSIYTVGTRENFNGVMTYIIYKIIKDNYDGGFDDISDGVKVLECACDEFKRRVLHVYEDKKIIENGDVE